MQLIVQFVQEHIEEVIPLGVTILFSVLNTFLAAVNMITAKKNLKIAESQRGLQNNIFCYQLYEKRMEIYTNIQKILSDIIKDGVAEKNHLIEFSQCTRDVPFLFGNDIIKLKNDTYSLIYKMYRCSAAVQYASKKQVIPENHKDNCDMELDLLNQITDLQSSLKTYFKPYISFGNYKVKEINEEAGR